LGPLEIAPLRTQMASIERPWYRLSNNDHVQDQINLPNDSGPMNLINPDQWLQLIIEHHNTWAWK